MRKSSLTIQELSRILEEQPVQGVILWKGPDPAVTLLCSRRSLERLSPDQIAILDHLGHLPSAIRLFLLENGVLAEYGAGLREVG